MSRMEDLVRLIMEPDIALLCLTVRVVPGVTHRRGRYVQLRKELVSHTMLVATPVRVDMRKWVKYVLPIDQAYIDVNDDMKRRAVELV